MVPSRPRKSSDVVQSSKPRSRAESSKRVSTASKSVKSVSNVSPSVSRITPSRPRVSSDSVPMSKPRVRTLSSKRLSVQSSPVPSDVLLDVLIQVPSSLAPDSARRGSALLTASRPTSTSMTEQSHSVLAPSTSTNIEGTPALVPDLAQHGSERVTASRPTSLSVTEQSHAPTVSVPVNTTTTTGETENVLVPDLARRGSSHLTASRPTSASISSTQQQHSKSQHPHLFLSPRHLHCLNRLLLPLTILFMTNLVHLCVMNLFIALFRLIFRRRKV